MDVQSGVPPPFHYMFDASTHNVGAGAPMEVSKYPGGTIQTQSYVSGYRQFQPVPGRGTYYGPSGNWGQKHYYKYTPIKQHSGAAGVLNQMETPNAYKYKVANLGRLGYVDPQLPRGGNVMRIVQILDEDQLDNSGTVSPYGGRASMYGGVKPQAPGEVKAVQTEPGRADLPGLPPTEKPLQRATEIQTVPMQQEDTGVQAAATTTETGVQAAGPTTTTTETGVQAAGPTTTEMGVQADDEMESNFLQNEIQTKYQEYTRLIGLLRELIKSGQVRPRLAERYLDQYENFQGAGLQPKLLISILDENINELTAFLRVSLEMQQLMATTGMQTQTETMAATTGMQTQPEPRQVNMSAETGIQTEPLTRDVTMTTETGSQTLLGGLPNVNDFLSLLPGQEPLFNEAVMQAINQVNNLVAQIQPIQTTLDLRSLREEYINRWNRDRQQLNQFSTSQQQLNFIQMFITVGNILLQQLLSTDSTEPRINQEQQQRGAIEAPRPPIVLPRRTGRRRNPPTRYEEEYPGSTTASSGPIRYEPQPRPRPSPLTPRARPPTAPAPRRSGRERRPPTRYEEEYPGGTTPRRQQQRP